MSDKRIIELDVTDVVENDDFLAIDSVSGTTRRIKPIKIGATYEIEDGDHSFTLVGSNGYSHTVDIPYDSETINLADFNQLTPEEQDNGTAYYVPDKDVPVADELWAKVGRTQLDGTTQDLSKAHNNLMTRVDDLEDTVGDTALPSGMSSVTDGISQLNSSMVYEKVCIENGNDKSYIEREGRKVFINFGTSRINVLLGYTLPAQFRPSDTIRLMVIIVNANTNTFTMGRVVITSDGHMKFFTISNYGGQPAEITGGQDWAVYDCVSYFR